MEFETKKTKNQHNSSLSKQVVQSRVSSRKECAAIGVEKRLAIIRRIGVRTIASGGFGFASIWVFGSVFVLVFICIIIFILVRVWMFAPVKPPFWAILRVLLSFPLQFSQLGLRKPTLYVRKEDFKFLRIEFGAQVGLNRGKRESARRLKFGKSN